MTKTQLDRRKLLKGICVISTAASVNILYGVRIAEAKNRSQPGKFRWGRLKAYIRSGRNKSHISQASLKHCHRYIHATRAAARNSPAHIADNADVKSVYITRKKYLQLFVKPRTKKAYVSNLNTIV